MRPQNVRAPSEDPWVFRHIRLVGPVSAGAVVALAATLYFGLIYKSSEERYLADQKRVRLAAISHYSGFHPDLLRTVTRESLPDTSIYFRYPSYALRHNGKANAMLLADVANTEITTLGGPFSNPVGNTQDQSRRPLWEDADGDGSRNTAGEKLFYEGASPAPNFDHWNTSTVREAETGTEYVVDSRDWFIDMQYLLELAYLKELPESASPDNHPDGTGSYSWYVDEDGEIESLLYRYPIPTSGGYQDVYP